MSGIAVVLRGRVANGVVVLEPGAALPDGTEVTVTPAPAVTPTGPAATGHPPGVLPFTPEEQAEFAGWDKIGDEAWGMIDWGEGEIARDSG
ncbi:MAG TPA: hypothetical protein VH092_01310 [Urbifossiella sp.]|jgi:hypothetical protein|nr:hypothetical protein [Urbifossiella sp.]